jgi:glycosyltransferase involved in cell wall biosynthesis
LTADVNFRPLVSIIVTARDKGPWLADTLKSVTAQSWRPLEIVVVDDGSIDQTPVVIEAYASQIAKVHRLEGRGSSVARNVGFASSTGDFVQFLDGDDLLTPGKIEVQLKAILDSPGTLAIGSCERFRHVPGDVPSSRTKGAAETVDAGTWAREKFEEWGTFTHSWLVPRDVALRAGTWNEALIQLDDPEFFVRVVLASSGVTFCPDALVYYRSGVSGSVAGDLRPDAHTSSMLATALCERYLRRFDIEGAIRTVFAARWWLVAQSAYPHNMAVYRYAFTRSYELGEAPRPLSGGRLQQRVARLVGWRLAKRLRMLADRLLPKASGV